jgi:hypothetical protein
MHCQETTLMQSQVKRFLNPVTNGTFNITTDANAERNVVAMMY